MNTEIRLAVSPFGAVTSDELESIVLELKDEIEQATRFETPVSETHVQNEGTLGPEWVPVLVAVLSAPVAVEMTKGILSIVQDWLSRRKPVKITFHGPKGSYAITGENVGARDLSEVVASIIE
jgi:hypothetical protein